MKGLKKGNLKDPAAQQYTIYNDGELAFCKDAHNIRPQSVQLEVYAIMLVLAGKTVFNINGMTYEATKNDLFICTPNNIIEDSQMSADFKGCFIFTSTAYIERVVPLTEKAWELKMYFDQHPLCSLRPDEAKVFRQYYDLLCNKVQQATPASKKVIDTLMLAFFYDMQNHLERVVQLQKRPFTSGEYLFRRFIGLLESSYPKPRLVSYYADRLNVTPKYLSAVCKQISGERPSTLIDRYVVRDIDHLMKYTRKSIKEIACELDFPNLSFFGKYVKKHRGASPKAYREKMLEEKQDGDER